MTTQAAQTSIQEWSIQVLQSIIIHGGGGGSERLSTEHFINLTDYMTMFLESRKETQFSET